MNEELRNATYLISPDDFQNEKTCFTCGQIPNGGSPFVKNGYLLRSLYVVGCEVQLKHSQSFCFFEQSISYLQLLLDKKRSDWFNAFRFQLNKLEKAVHKPESVVGVEKVCREEINQFLKHILHITHQSILPDNFTEDIFALVRVRRFHQLDTKVLTSTNALQQNYFHLCLEISAYSVLIVTSLFLKDTSSKDLMRFFDSITQKLVWDLVYLANYVYQKEPISSIWKRSLFFCSCVDELWLMLMHILDTVSKKVKTQSFWSVLSCIINELGIESVNRENGIRKLHYIWNTSCEFKLWLICKIAPIYRLNESGTQLSDDVCRKTIVPGNWQAVQELIQDLLQKDNIDEKCIVFLLRVYCQLNDHWSFHFGIFKALWDQINKMMPLSYPRDLANLNSYVTRVAQITPLIKFETYKAVVSKEIDLHGDVQSFELFCDVFERIIERVKDLSPHFLSQIKGRILSKFHKKRMEDIVPIDFERFVTLFLKSALAFDSMDVVHKMCLYIGYIPFDEKSLSMKRTIFLVLFTGVLICKDQKYQIDYIIERIVELFTRVITKHDLKDSIHQDTWSLICFYFECVEQCLDFVNCLPCEEKLICAGYSKLLKIMSRSERLVVLQHLKNIFGCSYIQGEFKDLLISQLWTVVFVQIEGVVSDDLAADLLADFTVLSLSSKQVAPKTFQELFSKFANNTSQSLNFKCSYLSKVLSSSDVRNVLSYNEHSNNRYFIVNTWIHCILLSHINKLDTLEFTRALFEILEFSKYIKNISSSKFLPCEYSLLVLLKFTAGIGGAYMRMQSVTEMSNFRKIIDIFFHNVLEICKPVLIVCDCMKTVDLMFVVSGNLAKYCAKAIYSKSSPVCLLPQLLDLFVLPLNSSKKPFPPPFLEKVFEHLHLFLSGLISLDFKKDDFLARKIKEVFHRYFIQCSIKSFTVQASNPFLLVLKESEEGASSKQSSDYRFFVLTLLRDHFLYLPQPAEQLAAVLYFIISLLQATESSEELIICADKLLIKLLNCLLACEKLRGKSEPPHVRQLVMNILKIIFDASGNKQSFESELASILISFASEKLPSHQNTILVTLALVGSLNKSVLKMAIPSLYKLVLEEEKRVGGESPLDLRNTLGQLKEISGCDLNMI